MTREIKVDPLSYDGYLLYEKPEFTFYPGMTCLVGCNGSGKTTLMNRVMDILKKEKTPFYSHYDKDAKKLLKGRAEMRGTREDFVNLMSIKYASEGESIAETLAIMAQSLGYFVLTEHKDDPEIWLFFDSLDSGLSIDAMDEVAGLFGTILRTKPKTMDIYIVMAVNSFEFARRWMCLDVQTGRNGIRFEYYEDYSEFIFDTRKKKDANLKKGPIDG